MLLTPKLRLIFSLASALTFTSPPPRRLALDVPPVAFFIPGGDECVYVLARLCLERTVFSIYQRKRTWADLGKTPAERRLREEACDSDWRINLNPLL